MRHGRQLVTGRLSMIRRIHLAAGLLRHAALPVSSSRRSRSRRFGTHATVAALKSLIVMPGLLILVPAIAATGGSGFALSRSRSGRLVEAKKRRMPFIAANGLLVLVPCALLLDRWAAAGAFDGGFYLVQAVELIAGAVNLSLMGLNIRDGLRMRPPGRHKGEYRSAQHAGTPQ
jgi:hypothetical protein